MDPDGHYLIVLRSSLCIGAGGTLCFIDVTTLPKLHPSCLPANRSVRDTGNALVTALHWVLQNGIAASIRPPASFGRCTGEECQLGIARQASCFDSTLTEKEMAELDGMEFPDDNPTLFSSAGCP